MLSSESPPAQRRCANLLLALIAVASTAGVARAQRCGTDTSRVAAPRQSVGRAIHSLQIVTLSPAPLPRLVRALDRVHARTREATVKRELLFAAGDTVDSL